MSWPEAFTTVGIAMEVAYTQTTPEVGQNCMTQNCRRWTAY